MISKNRSVPLTLKKEEVLLRRLPVSHPQYPAVSDSLARRRRGYKGEQAVDYFLNQLDYNSCHIFHDLRFRSDSHFFQIDTLLVTPHYLLIIEVKNISGTLYFDTDFNQMIRSLPDKEEGFRNPLTQAVTQKNLLYDFLLSHGFSNLPIEYVIAISYPSTIIKATTPEISEVVIHAECLPEKVQELTKKHAAKEIAQQELQRLKKLLLASDIPLDVNVLQKYHISASTILSGVQCPSCSFIPMNREKRKWQCPSCGTRSATAHEQAIEDYFLLFSPEISNQACRIFLNHPSRTTVKRYLVNMNLQKSGHGKSTTYHR